MGSGRSLARDLKARGPETLPASTSREEETLDPRPEETLAELTNRLTYLEAFSIACFIVLKERLRRDGEDEAAFGVEFQTVFREAMRFLDAEEEAPEDDWGESLDCLIRHVEHGDDLGFTLRS
jgi:hypothetical protein